MHRYGLAQTREPMYDRPRWQQYALALLLVGAALGARWLMGPVVGDRVPFLTLFIVLMPLVVLVRTGPFLTGATVGLLGVLVLFIPPRFSLRIDGPDELLQIALFALAIGAAALTSWLSRRQHQRVRSADLMLRSFVDESPTCKWITGPNGRILYMNQAMAVALGKTRAEVLGKTHEEILPPSIARTAVAHIEHVRRTGEPRASFEEIGPIGPDKTPRILEWRRFALRLDEDGSVLVAGMANDVTEKARLQKALEESERRMEIALNSSGAVPWGWNVLDNTLDEWTPAYRDLYGFDEECPAGFERWIERVLPEERDRLMQRVAHMLVTPGDDIWSEEFRIQHPTRGERWIMGMGRCYRDAAGKAVRMTGVNIDITDRKHAEAELRSHRDRLAELVEQRTAQVLKAREGALVGQRMAAVGTLAAGLAHDMNNVIFPLSGRLDALITSQALPQSMRSELAVVIALLDHLRQLANNLSLFSSDPERDSTDPSLSTDLELWQARVKGLIEASVWSGERGGGRWVQIKWNISGGLSSVALSPHALTQAVLNLVQNARDAILAKRPAVGGAGGCITVSASPGPNRGAVVISVSDDGCGMDETTAARCTEPFFTTKNRPSAAGLSGSGLGMALVHSIVERAGGKLDIDSRPGEGTTISMILPEVHAVRGAQATVVESKHAGVPLKRPTRPNPS